MSALGFLDLVEPEGRLAMGTSGRRFSDGEATTGAPWPYCAAIEGTCLAFETGQFLGASVLSTLLTFILAANEGGRLTLQKSREDFTVQVTGAVERTTTGKVGLPEVRALRKKLDMLSTAGTKG